MYQLWQFYTKQGTDTTVEYALRDARRVVGNVVNATIDTGSHQLAKILMVHEIGGLLLGQNNLTAMQPTLDRHLYNSLDLYPHLSSVAVGFESGEYKGMRFDCQITGCDTNIISSLEVSRSNDDYNLFVYGTEESAQGQVEVTTNCLHAYGTYVAFTKSWYPAFCMSVLVLNQLFNWRNCLTAGSHVISPV